MNSLVLLLAIFMTEPEKISEAVKPKQYTSYEQALLAAKEQNKYLMVIVTSQSCIPCEQLQTKTLRDKQVSQTMDNLIVYCVKIETEEGQRIMRGFEKVTKIRVVPSYYIINPHKHQFCRTGYGYKAPRDFIRWIGILPVKMFRGL